MQYWNGSLLPVLMVIGHGTYAKTGLLSTDVQDKGECIEITGQTVDSGTQISKVITKREGQSVVIEIHWVACGLPHPLWWKRQLPEGVTPSGLKHYRVLIPPDVNLVVMGKERIPIWTRAKGSE